MICKLRNKPGTCRLKVKKLYRLHHTVRIVYVRKNGCFQTVMLPGLDDARSNLNSSSCEKCDSSRTNYVQNRDAWWLFEGQIRARSCVSHQIILMIGVTLYSTLTRGREHLLACQMETTYSPRLIRFIPWWMRNPHPSSMSAITPLWDMDRHVAGDKTFRARNLLSSRLTPYSSFSPFCRYVFRIFFRELDSLTNFMHLSETLRIHKNFPLSCNIDSSSSFTTTTVK